jgi:hypothetical protein
VIASVVVVLGHTATFLLAAATTGSSATVAQLVPIAVLVLAAMGLPTSIGGWGPREGVAAWAFAAAGLGAGIGLTTAVSYGVLALAATLPGAVVMGAAALQCRLSRRDGATPARVAVGAGVVSASSPVTGGALVAGRPTVMAGNHG